MSAGPDLQLVFASGRECGLPSPSTAQLAAVRLLTPPAGSAELPRQFLTRLVRQVDTMLAGARWHRALAGDADVEMHAAQLNLSEAIQLVTVWLAAAVGLDHAPLRAASLEAFAAVASLGPVQTVPLGELLAHLANATPISTTP